MKDGNGNHIGGHGANGTTNFKRKSPPSQGWFESKEDHKKRVERHNEKEDERYESHRAPKSSSNSY